MTSKCFPVYPELRTSASVTGMSSRAKTGCEQMQQHRVQTYSITSSARASSAGGRVRANAFAVFRLIRSSNLVA